MFQSTALQRIQVFFVGSTCLGVWLNLIYNHQKKFKNDK